MIVNITFKAHCQYVTNKLDLHIAIRQVVVRPLRNKCSYLLRVIIQSYIVHWDNKLIKIKSCIECKGEVTISISGSLKKIHIVPPFWFWHFQSDISKSKWGHVRALERNCQPFIRARVTLENEYNPHSRIFTTWKKYEIRTWN